MNKLAKIIALISISILCACGGQNTTINKELKLTGATKYKIKEINGEKINREIDPKFSSRVRERLESHLRSGGLLQEGSSGDAYNVSIDITKYRFKQGTLRFFTGPFSGKEFVESVITVKDKSGKSLGTATVYTYTYNIVGVNTLGAQHAKEIAEFLMKK